MKYSKNKDVILLHGLFGSLSNWGNVIKNLDKDHRNDSHSVHQQKLIPTEYQ